MMQDKAMRAMRDPWLEVGERLRRAREQRGMTLRALAARIGVSPSLISQIETAKVKPSVGTLYSLALELSVSLDELLFGGVDIQPVTVNSGPDLVVQRAGERPTIEVAPGIVWERLTGPRHTSVDVLRLSYEPGRQSTPRHVVHRHRGREWGYVLEGTLQVDVDGVTHVLEEGDAVAYSSTLPHRVSNPGTRVVRALWYTLGQDEAARSLHPALSGEQPTTVDVQVDAVDPAVLEQEHDGVDDVGHGDEPADRGPGT
jgi:transcriptional regulator with XRE-family HTH domain